MNYRMLRRAFLIAGIAALAAWSATSQPGRHIADALWADDAAPWESVTAVYVPDMANPGQVVISDPQFANLDECRTHISDLATEHGDPDLEKGRYECAVGFYHNDDKAKTGAYRLTLQ
ncbi:hypothetical protein LPB41_29735 [Thalassospira sp. MA62]|nr:hypothetical protein [Thalassospira sp. MA62]